MTVADKQFAEKLIEHVRAVQMQMDANDVFVLCSNKIYFILNEAKLFHPFVQLLCVHQLPEMVYIIQAWDIPRDQLATHAVNLKTLVKSQPKDQPKEEASECQTEKSQTGSQGT